MNSSRHSKATAEIRRQLEGGTMAGGKLLMQAMAGGKLLMQAKIIRRLRQQLPAAPFYFRELFPIGEIRAVRVENCREATREISQLRSGWCRQTK